MKLIMRTIIFGRRIIKYLVEYLAEVGGSIDGKTIQHVKHGESGSEVTAIPDEGYRFNEWDDGILTESRVDTDVSADITVTASFSVIPEPEVEAIWNE